MSQYDNIKTQFPDHMVLFQIGDFYEIMGSDAGQYSKCSSKFYNSEVKLHGSCFAPTILLHDSLAKGILKELCGHCVCWNVLKILNLANKLF